MIAQMTKQQDDTPKSLQLFMKEDNGYLPASLPQSAIQDDDQLFTTKYLHLLHTLEEIIFEEEEKSQIKGTNKLRTFISTYLSQYPLIPQNDRERICTILETRCFTFHSIESMIPYLSIISKPHTALIDQMEYLSNITFRNPRNIDRLLSFGILPMLGLSLEDGHDIVSTLALNFFANIATAGQPYIQQLVDERLHNLFFPFLQHPTPRVQLTAIITISRLVCASPNQLQLFYFQDLLSQLAPIFPSLNSRNKHELLVCLNNLSRHSITPILASLFYSTGFHVLVVKSLVTVNEISDVILVLNTILSVHSMYLGALREIEIRPPTENDSDLLSQLSDRDPLVAELMNTRGAEVVQQHAHSRNETARGLAEQVLIFL
ncbi:hypothetical protein BLNAU_596 [Blattamonas nauphoetae]|uniref:Uncharacterized protein n=1 Tax=Blattamonas nauphoetae TaxID=2049346 RepID=A0ABQ9YLN8_9EUKA|nr:hypothetical protein BLNAU_596 [Blattamonas nauphoetae]